MIIGIDANKATAKNRTGIENFVFELILNLLKIDAQNTYYLFAANDLPDQIIKHKNVVQIKSKFSRPWNKIVLPLLLRQNKPDVYLQPLDGIPMFAPEKTIGVIHDLAYKYFPEAYSGLENRRQNGVLSNVNAKAKKIICVSESTKTDVLDFYPESKSKIKVIHLGYDPEVFHSIEKPKDVLKTDGPYILFAGRLEERKNVKRLVEAFLKVKAESNIPQKLVLAGSPGYNYSKIYQAIVSDRKYINEIIMPGHISHAQMPDLIAKADFVVFPTLYEGFGLPVLEAMACGAAVVAAKSSSLPEVAGEAAVYVNPLDVDDIAEGINYLIQHPETKKHYQGLALERAKDFSWEKTAKEFLNELESL
ncbi:MAG: glycosyltransferase family 1 protein [Patescibacteria group bacterium]|jgi:glycosyltransferase involved in cell wall biosynthesis